MISGSGNTESTFDRNGQNFSFIVNPGGLVLLINGNKTAKSLN
jgi:hypothetical protein